MCDALRRLASLNRFLNLKWSFFNAHIKSIQVSLTLLSFNLLTQKRDNGFVEVASRLYSDAAAFPAAAALAIFPLSSAT